MQTIRFKVADGREQDFEKYWSEHGEALKAAKHGKKSDTCGLLYRLADFSHFS